MNEKSSLNSEILTLTTTLNNKINLISQYESSKSNASSEFFKLQTDFQNLKSKNEALKASCTSSSPISHDESVALLTKQMSELQACLNELNIEHTSAIFRANNLQDEMNLCLSKKTKISKNFEGLNNTITHLNHEKILLNAHVTKLVEEINTLKDQLTDYEDKLYKQGQTKQTIFMNKPKEFKAYDDKKGLGFDRPGWLAMAQAEVPTLYNSEYMRYGLTMNFIRVSDEEKEIEDFNRSTPDRHEIPYYYDVLNTSHDNRKLSLSDDYFPSYSQDELKQIKVVPQGVPEVLTEQVIFQKPYVPTLILEK